MDEMRIVSKFTRGIISKAIKMVIRKKTGYNIDIQLNEANLVYQFKKKTNRIPSTRITLPGKVVTVN